MTTPGQDLTIVLLRHAEKDLAAGTDKDDPGLSPEGLKRAARLVDTLKKYQPEEIFATTSKRARETAEPLAEQIAAPFRIQVHGYDETYLDDLAERLLKTSARCVVVVGHKTTTPMLANALVKKEDKYTFLDESEYDKIWIIRIRKDKIVDKLITY